MTSTPDPADASLSRSMRFVGLMLTLGAAFLLWADVDGTAVIAACLIIGLFTFGGGMMPMRVPEAKPIRVRSRR